MDPFASIFNSQILLSQVSFASDYEAKALWIPSSLFFLRVTSTLEKDGTVLFLLYQLLSLEAMAHLPLLRPQINA